MNILPITSSDITLTESATVIDRGELESLVIRVPAGLTLHYVCLLDNVGKYHREFCLEAGSTYQGGVVIYGTDIEYHATTRILGDSVSSHLQILGIARDHARLDIRGSSIVDAPYRHTQTRVDQNNIFLGIGGQVRGMPILEIATDDIVGGHSCRMHRIAGEALFYLQSHGLDTTTAEGLLIDAELRRHTSVVTDCDMCDSLVEEVRAVIFSK